MPTIPATPEDLFVELMDFVDDVELYVKSPRRFKVTNGITLKERTQQMRVLFAKIPRATWLYIRSLILFSPDVRDVLEEMTKHKGVLAREQTALQRARSLLEQMKSWVEPPLEVKEGKCGTVTKGTVKRRRKRWRKPVRPDTPISDH